jgi:high-affinity Fe2+/Pb2+ permease
MLGSPAAEPRRLSAILLLGILILPVIFFWFLLRRGYSTTLREAAFLYMAVNVMLGLFRAFLG